jgi:glycosyltransferase involved in cell wall biosynthesis
MPRQPRVAIVSDPLVQRGGAEKVVEVLAEMFPQAPIFALLYSPLSGPAALQDRIRESWLSRIPGAARRHRWFFPLYPSAVESFDLHEYDLIISSHHTVAKGLLRNASQAHVCYCHTPMRALWERPAEELRTQPRLLRPALRAAFDKIRVWDYVTAARVDQFVANSAVTQSRIAKHYGRASTIVYPPIDTETFTPGPARTQDYYLAASRNVPYKRVDIAVAATRKLGRRLVVTGSHDGRTFREPHVTVTGHLSNDEFVDVMRGARALLFPGFEDFGMAPVEMMACGRPVIAFGRGGAAETVIHGITGLLVAEQTVDAFADAIARFEELDFDVRAIRARAEEFSGDRFRTAMQEICNNALER